MLHQDDKPVSQNVKDLQVMCKPGYLNIACITQPEV